MNHTSRNSCLWLAVLASLFSFVLGQLTANAAAGDLQIVAPATGSWTTTAGAVSLQGTAPGGTVRVEWRNNTTGASGTAVGATGWRAGGIALNAGANTINVTARDGSGVIATSSIVVTRTVTAQQAQLTAVEDATVRSGSPSSNLGSDPGLVVGFEAGLSVQNERALIKFDLGSLPAGTIINSAALRLHEDSYFAGAGANINVTAYRATGPWTESAVTWTSQPDKADAGATMVVVPDLANTTLSWDVAAITRAWLTGSPNYGVKLMSNNEDELVTSARQLSSRESANPPVLAINFSPESEPPSIQIAAPTTEPLFITSDAQITVSGTASDNAGLASVRWTNITTAVGGDVAGLSAWSTSVSLASGLNVISIIATDVTGNTANETLFVRLQEPDTTPPSAPSDVAVTVLSVQQMTVSWSASTDAGWGISGYKVYRGGALVTNTPALAYADAGLTPGASYCYVIVAVDAAGNTNAAAPVCATTMECSFAATPSVVAAPAQGLDTNIVISASAGCSWAIGAIPAWVTVTPPSGSGAGMVGLTVAANAGTNGRAANLSLGNASISISQAGTATPGCSVTVDPGSLAFGRDGGTQSVTVAVSGDCSWNVSSAPDWISASPASGGNGDTVTVAISTNATSDARVGIVAIGDAQLVVNQLPGPGGAICIGSVSNALQFALETTNPRTEQRRLQRSLTLVQHRSAATVADDALLFKTLAIQLKPSTSDIVQESLWNVRDCVVEDLQAWSDALAQRIGNMPVSTLQVQLQRQLDRARAALDKAASADVLKTAAFSAADSATRLRAIQRTLDRRHIP